jgi:hypothetical protein
VNENTDTGTPHGYPGDEDYVPGQADTLDDLLGAAAPALTFPEIGTSYTGVILNMAKGIQRDPDGTERTFDDGTPRPQGIITLQTDEHDDDDDDGQRRLFVKGAMIKSYREACRRAKVRGPRIGDTITVAYTADGEKKGRGMNPPKLFTIDITPAKA